MTTNQTIDGVPRSDLELALVYGNLTEESREAGNRLRALLDAESAPCAKSQVEPAAQPQGEPVAIVTGIMRDSETLRRLVNIEAVAPNTLELGQKLYAEQPAPVAVALPEDWQDKLLAEMDRRFKLRKHIDDDHMVNDDTQIGVEFACDWMAGRLKSPRPVHANPPPGAEPSGTHPHNDGLDEMRNPK